MHVVPERHAHRLTAGQQLGAAAGNDQLRVVALVQSGRLQKDVTRCKIAALGWSILYQNCTMFGAIQAQVPLSTRKYK